MRQVLREPGAGRKTKPRAWAAASVHGVCCGSGSDRRATDPSGIRAVRRYTRESRGPGFMIDADKCAPDTMVAIPPGPYLSLDDALRAVEKHMHGACRHAPDQR
jgi:hypothetical protein